MSAEELAARLRESDPRMPLDLVAIRNEIHTEFEKAERETDRILLLSLFQTVMDAGERAIAAQKPEDLNRFRAARLGDYRALLVREAMQDEQVVPARLLAVIRRETASGRLAPGDELVRLATNPL